jgi:ABC-type transport system involved in cytochrome bd biosynthesis fused ATPase/permease subunit
VPPAPLSRSLTKLDTARGLLVGSHGALAASAAALTAERVALPVAAVWLSGGRQEVAAALVVAAICLGLVRALANERVTRAVRANVLEAYLGPFERAPLVRVPTADVIGSRLSVALPVLSSWASNGVVGFLASVLSLPLVLVVVVASMGPAILFPLAVASAAAVGGTALLARPVEAAANRAWERGRTLFRCFYEGYAGAVELRAHGRAALYADMLRAEVEAFSREDAGARRVQGIASRVVVAAAIASAYLGMRVLAPGLHASVSHDRDLASRALLLVLAAAPCLFTLANSTSILASSRGELENVRAQRALSDPPVEEVDQPVDPTAEIRLRGVSFAYPSSTASPTPALRDLDLVVPRRSSVAIVGANGAGKTTLLHVLLGMLRPDAGTITLDGVESRLDNPSWRSRIAYLAQRPLELQAGSIQDNLRVFHPQVTDADLARALERVGLWAVLLAKAGSSAAALAWPYARLSRGESRRVLLARTLVAPADLVVLDEPEANLDAASIATIAAALREQSDDVRIVAAVHDRSVMPWADQVIDLTAPDARADSG